ncbi:hypothetical protein [Puia dinghuensis]|uniref:Uncharacterized protein n=1 Tax=Puia dinghuensis TaxID=1792502 RepID=A0A8J2UDA2_9BACT|nr:hypothetical protein [Puia dinghuensis]GGB01826.1 hypothetical protein GCM10011511_26290 [Puia dinghuensis]
MIDGIQLVHYAPDRTHLTALSCWEVLVNEKTGQRVDDVRRASFRGLNMELKPAATGYRLTINGSLHKYHNGGEHNADAFPFTGLLDTISGLCAAIGVMPDRLELHGIEIGLNIPLPFTPLRVLNNAVCYKNKPFQLIHKRNKRKGLLCCLWDYDIKLYDKAAQSDTDCGDLLRFEVKVNKMRYLDGYGLTHLEALTDPGKVYPLIQVLTDALGGIIWTDKAAQLDRMNDREQKQWLYLGSPASWEAMNKYQLRDSRKKLAALFGRYVDHPISAVIAPLLVTTWKQQFAGSSEADNAPPFHRLSEKLEAVNLPTFSPLECIKEKVREKDQELTKPLAGFSGKEDLYIKKINNVTGPISILPSRRCISCGRDISGQDKRSRFCSEKVYGPKAKQCRNRDSNKRRDHKRILSKAKQGNRLINVRYRNNQGAVYTLHPTELAISRDWLDRVEDITILPPAGGPKEGAGKGTGEK